MSISQKVNVHIIYNVLRMAGRKQMYGYVGVLIDGCSE